MRISGKLISPLLIISFVFFLTSFPRSWASAEKSGESLFKEHCSACHPDGGNIFNPKKTLKQKDLEANNIKSAEAIVMKMRNPGPAPTHPQDWAGMKMFDKDKISDEDALKIAEYILKTFH
jgi:cytochrome c6